MESEPPMTMQQLEEDWHGRLAVETARFLGIFESSSTAWQYQSDDNVLQADASKYMNLVTWRKCMEADVRKQNAPFAQSTTSNQQITRTQHQPASVTVIGPETVGDTPLSMTTTHDARTSSADSNNVLSQLPTLRINDEQRRAYEMIVAHLDATLAGREPQPLRMMVHGEGGTGEAPAFQGNMCTNKP